MVYILKSTKFIFLLRGEKTVTRTGNMLGKMLGNRGWSSCNTKSTCSVNSSGHRMICGANDVRKKKRRKIRFVSYNIKKTSGKQHH